MARKPARQIDYGTLGSSDLVWLAQVDDDKQAIDEIFARVGKVVNRIAGNYCRRYTWIDPEDLSQSLMAEKLPKIIKCYRPGKNTDWEKYVYHRLTFSAKDLLRCEDPLGIGYPQKKQYPEWHRLGDEAFDGFEVAGRREMDGEELDMLKLYESIDSWRAAFEVCKPAKRKSFPRATECERPPAAWVDGKFLGVVVVRRKKDRAVGLVGWRRKPQQLVLAF